MAKRPLNPPPMAADALRVLGGQIRQARHTRRWTAKDLASRVGVSEATILAAESGRPGTAAGTLFHAAVLVGVPLFGVEDRAEMARMRVRGEERLALIPSRVRHVEPEGDPDALNF